MVSNYQEIWARQLQCLVSEISRKSLRLSQMVFFFFDLSYILRAHAKPLAQRPHTIADDPSYRGILDPKYGEFLGEQGMLCSCRAERCATNLSIVQPFCIGLGGRRFHECGIT